MRFLLTAALLSLCAAARAEGGPREGKTAACKDDVQKFCADVAKGGGRVFDCMKSHAEELSPACREAVSQKKEMVKQRMDEGKAACKGDLEKFCADVKPGEGRLIECLKKHEAELSEGCRKMNEAHHKNVEAMKEAKAACAGDAEKLCPGMMPGDGKLAMCLKDHAQDLSEPCAKVIKRGREKMEYKLGGGMDGKKERKD